MNEFAALGTNYVYLLRNLIGSFYVLHVLSVVLVLRHSIKSVAIPKPRLTSLPNHKAGR